MITEMKWREATTLEFVKIYLKHECLWNPLHMSYSQKYKREAAYKYIIQEFKALAGKTMTVPEVKTKIKSLRTTYAQEVHKILQKSRPDSTYKPSLVWFQEMDQCLKNVSFKKNSIYDRTTDITEMDSSSHSIWADDPDQVLQTSSFEDISPDPLVSQEITDTEYDPEVPDDNLSIVKIEPSPCRVKKTKKKKIKHKPVQKYVVKTRPEKTLKEDEFDIYGKYIASQLRKMDLNRSLKTQLAIQNVLSEARISEH